MRGGQIALVRAVPADELPEPLGPDLDVDGRTVHYGVYCSTTWMQSIEHWPGHIPGVCRWVRCQPEL
jgi:hypothetical protein